MMSGDVNSRDLFWGWILGLLVLATLAFASVETGHAQMGDTFGFAAVLLLLIPLICHGL